MAKYVAERICNDIERAMAFSFRSKGSLSPSSLVGFYKYVALFVFAQELLRSSCTAVAHQADIPDSP